MSLAKRYSVQGSYAGFYYVNFKYDHKAMTTQCNLRSQNLTQQIQHSSLV